MPLSLLLALAARAEHEGQLVRVHVQVRHRLVRVRIGNRGVKQLNKLINVLKVVELEPEDSVERRLLMIKVQADESRRTSVLQIVDLFRAHVVDVQPESVVIESIGSLPKLEALLRALEPYGVTELVQSGAVAIGRGSRSITDQLKEK